MENNTDMPKLSVYLLGEDWVIAESETEAFQILKEYWGFGDDDMEGIEAEELPNDNRLTINTEIENGQAKITKTCEEWIKENGKGYLCGFNF